jgi:hypothetical protein
VEVTRRLGEAAIDAFERAVPFAILQSSNLSKIKRESDFCCISQNQRSTCPFQEQREVFVIGSGFEVGGAELGIVRAQYHAFDFLALEDQTKWVL